MYSFIDWNIGDKKKESRAHLLFSLLHLLERYRPVPIVVELLDDRLYLLHCQVLPSQLKLALVVTTAVRLGGTKSSGGQRTRSCFICQPCLGDLPVIVLVHRLEDIIR